VTDLIPFKSESILANWQRIEDQNLLGTAAKRASSKGSMVVQGDLVGELDIYNFDKIFAAAIGPASSGEYSVTDRLTAANDQILRIELDKGVSRWRIGSAMINRMEISGAPNQPIEITCNMLCRDISRSSSAFPSLSLSNYSRLAWTDLATTGFIKIGAAGASAPTTAYCVNGFRFIFERNLEDPQHSSCSPLYAIEPDINGFRSVRMELDFPRYDSDQLATWRDADTALSLQFVLIHQVSGFSYGFYIILPDCRITEGANANIGGPGVVKNTVTFEAYKNVNSTYWSSIDQECRVDYRA
jgi:hypothetical protein